MGAEEFSLRVREIRERKIVAESFLKELDDKFIKQNDKEGWSVEIGLLSAITFYVTFDNGMSKQHVEGPIPNNYFFYTEGIILGLAGWGSKFNIDKVVKETETSK